MRCLVGTCCLCRAAQQTVKRADPLAIKNALMLQVQLLSLVTTSQPLQVKTPATESFFGDAIYCCVVNIHAGARGTATAR